MRQFLICLRAQIGPYENSLSKGPSELNFNTFRLGFRGFSGSSGLLLAPGSPWPSLGGPLTWKQMRCCLQGLGTPLKGFSNPLENFIFWLESLGFLGLALFFLSSSENCVPEALRGL